MSKDSGQSDADVMEWIAFASVVVFGLGMAYAIHKTNQVVQAVDESHNQKIIIHSQETNVEQAPQQQNQEPDQTQN